MLEKSVERHLVDAVKSMGGMCMKFVSPGLAGVPDRIVILPGGRIGFIELKAPGKKPRPLQQAIIRRLESLGVTVAVVDRPEMIAPVLARIGYKEEGN